MKFKSFLASFAAAALAVACTDSNKTFEPSLEINGLKLDQNAVTSVSEGTNFTFSVKSNVSFTVTSSQDWAKVTPVVAENPDKEILTTNVTVTVDENKTETLRTAAITIKTDKYAELDCSFDVNQAAAVYNRSLTVLSNTLESLTEALEVDDKDTQASVMVISTVSWTATSSADWLVAEPASVTVENYEETPTAVSFKIADNPTTEVREATVTFAGEGVESVAVTVKQKANIPFEVNVQLMSVTNFNPAYLKQYPDETSLAVIIGPSSVPVVSGYYGVWKSSVWSSEIEDWNSHIEGTISNVKKYGNAMQDNIITSINEEKKYFATIVYDLEPDVEYIFIAYFEDEKGRSYIDYSLCKTKAVSYDYNGFLKIGNYNMTCIDSGGNKNETNFNIAPTDKENEFYVKNPILDDGSIWCATFDPGANTLSINGIESGYEDDGNQFGINAIYGWWNKTNGYAYGYIAFTDSTAEDGSAPIVFSVNDNGYVSALNNYITGVMIYSIDTESFEIKEMKGWGAIFLGASTNIASATSASAANTSKKCCVGIQANLNGKRKMFDLARKSSNIVELR